MTHSSNPAYPIVRLGPLWSAAVGKNNQTGALANKPSTLPILPVVSMLGRGRPCRLGSDKLMLKPFGPRGLHAEIFAQVDAPHTFIFNNFGRGACRQHAAVANDVSVVADAQRFSNVMIGNQNPNITFF